MVDVALIEKLAQSPFLWSILCIAVVIVYYRKNEAQTQILRKQADSRESKIMKLYEDQKKESNLREEKLMNHLEKTTETLGHIEQGLSKLESKTEGGFQEVWAQFDMLRGGSGDGNQIQRKQ